MTALSIFLLGVPLLGDAFICVLRRLLTGQPIFHAHRLHLFQRLHQAGWTHSRVALSYVIATALLSMALICFGVAAEFSLTVVLLLVGIWLDQRVAVPFSPQH